MASVEHAVRSGENAAPMADTARAQLECLYAAHGNRVSAICAAFLRDRHEAEDAAQQVFVSAFRALLRGAEPRDPGAWLAAIARNESWQRARRQPSVPLQSDLRDVSQEDPSTIAARRGEVARLWEAVDGLPTSQRHALLLREVRGLGYDELADGLHLSKSSVRSLLNRARRTLRGELEKGAAALTGAPWLNLATRLFGDGSSTALSSASRTAAVGFAAVAISGGVVAGPSLTGHARHRPAVHPVVHRTVAVTRPAGETVRRRAAVPLVAASPTSRRHEPRVQLREDRRGRLVSREAPEGRHGSGSDSHDGPSASSDGGRSGSGSRSGSESAAQPESGSDGSGGGGPGPSDGSQVAATSSSSSSSSDGGASGGSGGRGPDVGSTSGDTSVSGSDGGSGGSDGSGVSDGSGGGS